MTEEAPPRELVVDPQAAPGDSGDGGGTAMAPYVMTVLGAGALAKYVSPAVGLVGLLGAIAVLLALRKPGLGRFVLRVDGDQLEIAREKGSSPATRVPLRDLLDVTLERKSEANARGGGSKERVRIALERRAPEEPIFVPEDRITPLEAQEWLGKVRVFLRKNGWTPKDEH
jgi:hypothetical protein